MSQSFPWYEQFAQRARNSPQPIDNLRLSMLINNNPQCHAFLAMLIQHHECVNRGNRPFSTIPYGGSAAQAGGTFFRTRNIPPDLLQIFQAYFDYARGIQ